MSKRIDITNQIFNDIYVLEYFDNKNSHAEYKCLCMLCNKVVHVTYSNLTKKNNTKSCASCGQKKISNGIEQDIANDLRTETNISSLARKYGVNRRVIYRIEREYNSLEKEQY